MSTPTPGPGGELAYPWLDEPCRKLVVQFVNIQLADNAKARELTVDGTWKVVEPKLGEPTINAQELLLAVAYRRAHGELVEGADSLLSDAIHAELPVEHMRKLASLPSMTHPDEALLSESKAVEEPEVTHVEARIIEDDEPQSQAEAPETAEPEDVVEEMAEAEALGEEPQEQDGEQAATATEASGEPAPEPADEPASQAQKAKSAPAASTAIEPRTPGRLKVAMRLIGMGMRELFTGRITREAKQRGRRR